MENPIAVIDFGSQYTQLIVRRIREFGYFSKLYQPSELRDTGNPPAVILSGGPRSTLEPDAPDIDFEYLRSLNVPVLGVCFGHQLLSHALGGRVGKNPQGVEGGTVEVRFEASDDPLFGPMPLCADLQAHHYETVLEAPSGSIVLASSERDRHQVLRHAPAAWGVQFHPELTLPMMSMLMDALATDDDQHGHAQMRDTLRPSPEGPSLLKRFVALARG